MTLLQGLTDPVLPTLIYIPHYFVKKVPQHAWIIKATAK